MLGRYLEKLAKRFGIVSKFPFHVNKSNELSMHWKYAEMLAIVAHEIIKRRQYP